MKYATFWQRLAAWWIDFFVFLPVVVLQEFAGAASKFAALLLVIPMAAVFLAYQIYFHGRYGQTIGKHAMAIRVVRTTGDRIGWREAWLRSSVDLAFAALGVIGSFVALAAIRDSEYYGVGWQQRTAHLASYRPAWLDWTFAAYQVWIWSEFVVILFNRKRRALHDFLAGTVVASEQKPTAHSSRALIR